MERAPDPRLVDLAKARRLLADLFDAAFYRGQAGLGRDDDGFAHYFATGARAGLKPNVVFEPAWYVARNRDAAGLDPLLHYALIGEPAGRDPSPWFDVAWYRKTYAAERPLAHYLGSRFGPVSPIPEFDADYYLKTYPDVGAAQIDPFLHYMHFGFREFRKPRRDFNPRLYANRFLGADRAANPVAHMRAHPEASPQARRDGPYEAIKFYARRGPRYEPHEPGATGLTPRALALAFHLTQFHRTPENDSWWGEGFTEWTHLARGTPRFAGHCQPRIPGELGFYDLSRREALGAQARLAKAAGIGGFVFYYYDFDGRRLLETPLELFLSSADIDMGFSLMWANENWTRRWDGAQDEALIAQTYSQACEAARAADLARHFRDPRYIRLDGRPLLMVYRAGLIPDVALAVARWRRLFAQGHGENPILLMAQTFDDLDPRPLGFDGAIEFPPHKLTKGLPQIYESLEIYDDAFEADVFAYDDLVAASLSEPAPDYPLIKTAVPAWDNDARRQGQGLTLVGSTPRRYQRWLDALIEKARPFFGARIVAVNAWNEWSEGAYLEPDVHFGAAYLNATRRAVFGLARPSPRPAPDPAGVQVFLLHRAGAPFPAARLRSIFAQSLAAAEIVVIDEGEDSQALIEAEAAAAGRDVALWLGVADGLAHAAQMASGDYVWIVEAEGRSDPEGLAQLLAPLLADPQTVLAFCDSAACDAEGRPVYARPPLLAPRRRLASFADRAFAGADFLALLAQAPAPCLSAMLWRREALAAGDARALVAAAAGRPGARVHHVADALDFSPL